MELPVEDEIENLEVGLNNIYKTISVLSEVPLDDVREIPKQWIDKMSVKTYFMNKQPELNKKSVIEWQEFNEISYDTFILYTQLQGTAVIDRMPALIKAMAKNKLTEEEILNLSLPEINTAFFFLRRFLKKYIARSITSSKKILRKQNLKRILHGQKPIRLKSAMKKEGSKEFLGGIS